MNDQGDAIQVPFARLQPAPHGGGRLGHLLLLRRRQRLMVEEHLPTAIPAKHQAALGHQPGQLPPTIPQQVLGIGGDEGPGGQGLEQRVVAVAGVVRVGLGRLGPPPAGDGGQDAGEFGIHLELAPVAPQEEKLGVPQDEGVLQADRRLAHRHAVHPQAVAGAEVAHQQPVLVNLRLAVPAGQAAVVHDQVAARAPADDHRPARQGEFLDETPVVVKQVAHPAPSRPAEM